MVAPARPVVVGLTRRRPPAQETGAAADCPGHAVAEQSSASAEQVSASTEETSASTEQIAASASDLAATAETLERLVGRFTVGAA